MKVPYVNINARRAEMYFIVRKLYAHITSIVVYIVKLNYATKIRKYYHEKTIAGMHD